MSKKVPPSTTGETLWTPPPDPTSRQRSLPAGGNRGVEGQPGFLSNGKNTGQGSSPTTVLTRHASESHVHLHGTSVEEMGRPPNMTLINFGGSKSCSAIVGNHTTENSNAPLWSHSRLPQEEDESEAASTQPWRAGIPQASGYPVRSTSGALNALDARVNEKLRTTPNSLAEETSSSPVTLAGFQRTPSLVKNDPDSVEEASSSSKIIETEPHLQLPQPIPLPIERNLTVRRSQEQTPGAYASTGRAPFSRRVRYEERSSSEASTQVSSETATMAPMAPVSADDSFVVPDSPLMAVCVDQDDLEHRIREEIIQSSSRADVIHVEDGNNEDLASWKALVSQVRQSRIRCVICATVCALIVMALIGVIIWGGFQLDDGDEEVLVYEDSKNREDYRSLDYMLGEIRKLGKLRCGVVGDPSWDGTWTNINQNNDDGTTTTEKEKGDGKLVLRKDNGFADKEDWSSGGKDSESVFAYRNPQEVVFADLDDWEQDKLLDRAATSKEYDICRAIAAAIFGKGGEAKAQIIHAWDWHQFILQDKLDLYIGTMNPTLSNDVFVADRLSGFTFSVPYYYQGLRFAGNPPDVLCAEALSLGEELHSECDYVKVCVRETSMSIQDNSILPGLGNFPSNQTLTLSPKEDVFVPVINGTCHVLAGYATTVEETRAREAGFSGEYQVGNVLVSKVPQVIETFDNAAAYSTFLNWILLGLFAAAREDITQSSADDFPQTTVFGDEYQDVFRNAVGAAGNMDDILSRDSSVQNDSLHLSNENKGYILARPIGKTWTFGYDVIANEKNATLSHIHTRGVLRCAIRAHRPGFAQMTNGEAYSGMDVDACRAVAAALFAADGTAVDFVEITSEAEGYSLLSSGEVDIMAGATWTLTNDASEDNAWEGFTFSQPYFFRPNDEQNKLSISLEENLCLATRAGDSHWSAFVHWAIAATIFAEEQDIGQGRAEGLPSIGSFGPTFEMMFDRVVSSVGNYGEIYERNLGSLIPRGGPNRLNRNPQNAVQSLSTYIPPGLGPFVHS